MAATATSSLELRIGTESFDITPFVRKFVWVESMLAGGFAWSLTLAANNWNDWSDIIMGRDAPAFQFRLRNEEDSGPQSTEWRTAVTDKSRVAFSQDTSMIAEIKGADRRLLMAQEHRTRSFAASSASSIISMIASQYNLIPSVDIAASISARTQAREDDWTFVRRIARETSTESGRGDAYLWLDEDTLHFAAPQLSGPSERRYDVSTVENRVDNYVCTYNGREADRSGAARLRGIGFDFATKKAITFDMEPGTAQSHPALAAKVPRSMADGLRIVPVFETDKTRVEEEIRAQWGRSAPRYMAIRVNTRPDLTLKPNTVIAMESNLGESRESPFMGRYAALEVMHTLEGGVISTSVVAYRREAQEGAAQPTGADATTTQTRDQMQDAGALPKTTVVAQVLS